MSMWRTPKGGQRVDHGVHERGGAADVRAFPNAFRAHRMVRARRHGVPRLPVRRLEGSGHEVVREVRVQVVALGVVLDLLNECHREAFCPGEPPDPQINDPLLGTMRWVEGEEVWLGDYNSIPYPLAYDRNRRLAPDLIRFAHDVLADPTFISASLDGPGTATGSTVR